MAGLMAGLRQSSRVGGTRRALIRPGYENPLPQPSECSMEFPTYIAATLAALPVRQVSTEAEPLRVPARPIGDILGGGAHALHEVGESF